MLSKAASPAVTVKIHIGVGSSNDAIKVLIDVNIRAKTLQ